MPLLALRPWQGTAAEPQRRHLAIPRPAWGVTEGRGLTALLLLLLLRLHPALHWQLLDQLLHVRSVG